MTGTEGWGWPAPVGERREQGKALRKAVPRSSHGDWHPGDDRPDPVDLLEEQNEDRLHFLTPVRRARMMTSPFTFYRGAARVMATDLARTPRTGLAVQSCGDAHLSNLGAYASPERRLVFDLNDFDETLPGPWEWDVKRLAVSFTIAGRHRGLDAAGCDAMTRRCVEVYRTSMAEFATMAQLDLWYDHLPVEDIEGLDEWSGDKAGRKSLERFAIRAQRRDSLQVLSKLAEEVAGEYRIRSDPPVLVPFRELPEDVAPLNLLEIAEDALTDYLETVRDDRAVLLRRFRPVDFALKVVGVGSVGTRCIVVLLEGRDRDDPLFLQIKEAGPSVLEEHLPASVYPNHGQRVVQGQRSMQAVSDIFLGWTRGGGGRDFYVRQLKDWKASANVESGSIENLDRYARLCGWTLARAHARTGDPAALSGYLGSGDTFDRALVAFAGHYADQNEVDHASFVERIRSGELAAADPETA